MDHTLTVCWADKSYTLQAKDGENLLDLLARNEIAVYAPCNGNGTCKKCMVSYESDTMKKQILACQTIVTEDAKIWVPSVSGSGLTEHHSIQWNGNEAGVGAAVDIGTTTVAAVLIDCSNGETIGSGAVINPQHVCGSDVISRIAACAQGKLTLQTTLIRKEISALLENLCRTYRVKRLESVAVCGNTTMLHLFCGADPTPIGVAPFTPVFTQMQVYDGDTLSIPAETVYVLPSASGYIGSDVVCGILSQKLDAGGICMLADLGTNGELALYNGGRLICTSTAAGPALEGANIECGIGGIPGAICAAEYNGSELIMHTIEDRTPVGICGSGLVDLIALLLECGAIEENGSFCKDCTDPLVKQRLQGDRFMLTDKLWISQKDIRQFQLAKAAVSAGILTLCDYAKVAPEELETLSIAGGLGYYINQRSALRTGLIPSAFAGKIRSVGNSGLAGAVECLLPKGRERAKQTAQAVQICELNSQAIFMEYFLDGMSFP